MTSIKKMEETMINRTKEMQNDLVDLTNEQMQKNIGTELVADFGKLSKAAEMAENLTSRPTSNPQEFALALLKAMIPTPELMGIIKLIVLFTINNFSSF